jgi:hypothetical protein
VSFVFVRVLRSVSLVHARAYFNVTLCLRTSSLPPTRLHHLTQSCVLLQNETKPIGKNELGITYFLGGLRKANKRVTRPASNLPFGKDGKFGERLELIPFTHDFVAEEVTALGVAPDQIP